ncbi:MAG: hypothetical protein AAGI14_00640 [Pseudomonadota bacterium]
MKTVLTSLIFSGALIGSAQAQVMASAEGYRVCAPEATQTGIQVAAEQCGTLRAPNFSNLTIQSRSELQTLESQRELFRSDVATYGQCITQLINSYRRPGAPADSLVPDQAACAHSWAQDQATQVVRDYGKACIDYSNRSMMDTDLEIYDGACYPTAKSNQQG